MLQTILHTSLRLVVAVTLLKIALPATAQNYDIKVGGAVRFQYSYENYSNKTKHRGGSLDLDTARINLDSSFNDILISAELRYYDYMQVVHHAWIGYDFSDSLRSEAGITQVPFGNLPFNSHSFFFSSNYYLGLEDDYDAGIKLSWLTDTWDLRLAFFKNDERGGVGAGPKRYSFDIIATNNTNSNNHSSQHDAVGEANTLVGRLAYTFEKPGQSTSQIGISALAGQLYGRPNKAGNYQAAAVHLNSDYGRWNLQLQASRYLYTLNNGANQILMGAYAGTYGIPAKATSYTANLAYRLPLSWGPISAATAYFDNSFVTNKSDKSRDTIMNIIGISLEVGPILAYLDLVSAKNQPFIGGSMIDNNSKRQHRLNLNVGYYF